MTDIPQCPKCGGENTYFDGSLYVCPDCGHEFNANEENEESNDIARDSNGAELFDGDAVTVIKDLKVKGKKVHITTKNFHSIDAENTGIKHHTEEQK